MAVFNMNVVLCKRDTSLYLNVRACQHTYGHVLITLVFTQVRHNLPLQQSQVRHFDKYNLDIVWIQR